MEQNPCAVQGALLIVDYWLPNLILNFMNVAGFAVWVQLHGLPLKCFMMEAGFQLERAVCEVVGVDNDEACQDGKDCWMECRYERIFKICRNCGKIDQTSNPCDVPLELAHEEIYRHLDEINQQLGTIIIIQEGQPLYTSRVRAFAHHEDRRTSTMVNQGKEPLLVPMETTMNVMRLRKMLLFYWASQFMINDIVDRILYQWQNSVTASVVTLENGVVLGGEWNSEELEWLVNISLQLDQLVQIQVGGNPLKALMGIVIELQDPRYQFGSKFRPKHTYLSQDWVDLDLSVDRNNGHYVIRKSNEPIERTRACWHKEDIKG
ncbi:hypothetical protein LOK49_LG01G01199 [Camellia lanceoleosa]|uniref:Uncharacterized protein n=1 Tax=Camellia lanceoleosa TaxID=1840588 RepID=A0ACC0IXY4_9ERIC|nr:hypothetical protein LOK49_LG01G01199 [Camellia lanceoleosa]